MPRFKSKWVKMWVKICNLNHVPKIGGSESLSCGKEGRFLKFPLMSICVSAASFTYCRVIIHFQGLFSCQGKGNARCLIHFCSLSLSHKFLSTLYPSNQIPSAVSLSSYFLCPSTLSCVRSFLPWASTSGTLGCFSRRDIWVQWNKMNGKRRQKTALCRNAELKSLRISFPICLFECNHKNILT